MNFNLVSPKGKGSIFTTRFQEEIEIPADATISLNFAKLTKDSRIVLDAENTIDFEFIEPIPFRDTAGAEAYPQGTTTDRRIIIPYGIYTPASLQNLITDGIQTTLNIGTANVATLTHNLGGMYNANVLSVNPNLTKTLKNDDLGITFQKNNFWDATVITSIDDIQNNRLVSSNFVLSDTHKHQGILQGNGQIYLKTTGGYSAQYDNYAIDDRKLYHYGTNQKAWENYRDGISTGVSNTRGTTDNIGKDTTNNQLNNYPFMTFKTDKTLATIRADNTANDRGGNFMGLLGRNYMVGTPVAANITQSGYVASSGRFSGNNPPITVVPLDREKVPVAGGGRVPVCYFGVEVGQNPQGADNNCYINVYCGNNINGNNGGLVSSRTEFPHNGAAITGMTLLQSWYIDDLELDPEDNVHIVILPYFKADPRKARTQDQTNTTGGFINRKELHFQVVLRSNTLSGRGSGDTVVYDTIGSRGDSGVGYINGLLMDGFESLFARADPAIVLTENQIDGQIPFNVMVSTKDDPAAASAGMKTINFSPLPVKLANQNLFPTIIDGVRFRISPELGGILTLTANNLNNQPRTTSYIYPSLACEQQKFFQISAIDSTYGVGNSAYAGLIEYYDLYSAGMTKSYCAYIENIPLRNYKNKIDGDGGQKGGIKKNIIKTIPLPFINTLEYGTEVIAYYEPTNKEVSELKNQVFKTNSFDISIRDMETDKISTHITDSVVNFTING
mgnify:CR=1 FL=1